MAIIDGTTGDDTLTGTPQDDTITTFSGTDTVDAGAGNDLIIVDENGQGTINGGAGFDTVQMNSDSWGYSYYDAFNAIAYLSTNIGSYTMTNVERVEGLNTSGGLNYLLLIGGAGADVFDGSTEGVLNQLSIFGGDGNDTLTGASVYSDLNGGDGDDIITAGSGGGNLVGGAGADTITAGSGYDQLSYSNSAVGITIDLSGATAGVGGDAQGDILSGQFEYVSLSQYADTATGSTFADNIYAGDGDDTINGGDGDDIIAGDAGSDTLTGGNGNDTFQYYNYDFNNEMADTITDFAIGDRLQMQSGTINGNYITPIFIGTDAFNNVSGEMRYEKTGGQTLVHLDSDGDGTADQTLTISNAEHDLLMVNVTGFSFDLVVNTSVTGTSGDDTINGTPGDDIIFGLGGNDTITTLTGNDTIDGGDGDDLIIIDEAGQGTIDGGLGDDTVELVSDSWGYFFYQGNSQINLSTAAGNYVITNTERFEASDTSGNITYLALFGSSAADTIDASSEMANGQVTIDGGDGNDTLTGAPSVFTLILGGNGNDVLNAGANGSRLIGGDGADSLIAGAGYDVLRYFDSQVGVTINLDSGAAGIGGTAQGDTFSGQFESVEGSFYNDDLTGSSGNDALYGYGGDDIISGGLGEDFVNGGSGIDTLSGGDGNDTLVGGNSADTMTGGTGDDIFSYYEYDNAFSDTITDFTTGDRIQIQQGSIGGTYMAPIFIGDAAFSGVAGEMRFEKTGGQTLIHLDSNGDMTANETLTISNAEIDLLAINDSGFGFDIVYDTSINGTSGDDTLNGTPGDDIINGLDGNDTITTFTGNDTIDGGNGDDVIIIDQGGRGVIDGGVGFDIVRITDNSTSFSFFNGDNARLVGRNTDVGNYNFSNIEQFEVINSSNGLYRNIVMNGTAGDDIIDASANPTSDIAYILAGSGADTITTSNSFNIVYAGSGDDTIVVGSVGSSIDGGAGADTMTGGAGRDTLEYGASTAAVTVNLLTGSASGGHATGDTFSSFERIVGSQFNDTITGDAGNNDLFGRDGDDIVDGGDGNDSIFLGRGADTITGGTGTDTFYFQGDSYEAGVAHEITDFEFGESLVFYSGFSFFPTFIGTTAFSGTIGELRYEKVGGETVLQVDTNGDGTTNITTTFSNGEFDLVQTFNNGSQFNLTMTPPPIDGTAGNDTLIGTPGDDTINGFAGDDIITTFTGTDTVDAGDGDDTVIISIGSQGNIDGGSGYDTLRVESATPPPAGSYIGGPDSLAGFQNAGILMPNFERGEEVNSATGEFFTLTLLGTNGVDSLDISAENIQSGGTFNAATGEGDDVVTVGTNTDVYVTVWAGNGNDTVTVGDLGSFVVGGGGADTITGGAGIDFVSYQYSPVGVSIDLLGGTANGGNATGDVLSGIENLRGSDSGNNSLTGDGNANQLIGGAFDDVLNGDGGDDFIQGGQGVDNMTGGAGTDIFFTLGDYEGGFTGTITDFEIGDTIAGSVNFQGPSGFFPIIWLGTSAFTGAVGELRYEKVGGQTLLHMDTSGDGLANETLTIANGEFDLTDFSDQVNNQGSFELRAPAVITPNLVTTIQDEIAEDTDLQTQGNDGTGLSLREAIAVANDTAGADTISYDTNVAGQIINTTPNGTIAITDDLDLSTNVTLFHEASNPLFDIGGSTQVTNDADIFYDSSNTDTFTATRNGILISGDSATFTNSGTINANGFGAPDADRTNAIAVNEANATINNLAGAFIVSQGRMAINSFPFVFNGTGFDYLPDFLTVNNDGIIESTDDAIRLGTGTINNTGTIRTTGEFNFGNASNPPGWIADAIAIVNQLDASFVPDPDGLLVVNNSATGLIEGARSGIQMQGGGTVNNDGTITGEVTGLFSGGYDDFSNIFVLNNTGTITAGTENYGLLNPDLIGSISLFGGLDSAVITNSGTINSGSFGIYSREGVDVTNTATGQIIGDTDGSGDDDVSFYGSQLTDFEVEASIVFNSPFGIFNIYSSQGVTQGTNGDLVTSVGTFEVQGQLELVQLSGVEADYILPLVDLTATQTAGFIVFQSDANGTIYPSPVSLPTTNNGTLTVTFTSGQPTTVTDASGDTVYTPSTTADYNDTIDNSGFMSGDVITGLGDDAIINRGNIADDVYLGTGNDNYTAGSAGTSGDIYAGDGSDIVNARGGDNTIYGEDGNDFLRGGEGNDILNGGFGVDYLRGGAGADQLLGYAGADWADYITSSAAVTVNLLANTGLGGEAQGDTYFLVERVYGSNHDDNITGDNGVNYLRGAGGDDMLFGGVGGDYLQGDAGADALDGGAGADWAYYVSSSAGLTVDLGNTANNTGEAVGDTYVSIENLFGSRFDDTLTGDSAGNFLRGFLGNDTLNGGAGDDFLRGDAGADVMDGGAGNDWLYYAASAGGVTIDLGAGTASGGHAAGDTFTNVERVFGSNSADTITGDGGINYLRGSGGNDALNGAGGTDFLQGDAGADALDGGAGTDWAYYVSAKTGVTVDLLNSSNNTGEAAGDTYVSIESVRGSSFDDVITGDTGTNYLIGGNGDDIITGGAGNDTLRGDAGADTFVFVNGTFRDRVIDYDDAENDMLDFSDFGFTDVNDALSNAADVNGDVVFTIGSDIITIENTTIIEITDNIIV